MVTTADGSWRITEGHDPVPSELTLLSADLCLRCGVRVWSMDRPIHDAWHLKVAFNG
jgi:hypothetical protein